MSGRRSVVLGLVIWVAVVALGSTAVWAVISRAGDGVASSGDPGIPTSSPAVTGSSRVSPSDTPSRSSAPTGSPSPAGPSSPTGSPSPAGSTASTGPPSPAGSPSVAPVEQRTWEGTAGRVVVECEGSAATVVAYPYSGYAMEIDERGPDRVEVEFEAGDDSDSRRRVRATCQAGVPVLEIDD